MLCLLWFLLSVNIEKKSRLVLNLFVYFKKKLEKICISLL